MRYMGLLVLTFSFLPGCTADRRVEPATTTTESSDALELLLLVGNLPQRIELRVDVDGKPVQRAWDSAFAKLHKHFDRDGNGSLDRTEASRLPAAFDLRQTLWGQAEIFAGTAPSFITLDSNSDGQVSVDELADGYRRLGFGHPIAGVGKPLAAKSLTAAIVKSLDSSQDGKLDGNEWKAAATVLGKHDTNGDDLVGPGELVEGLAYPGATGSMLLTAPSPTTKPNDVCDALPLLVLPSRIDDVYWKTQLAQRRVHANQSPLKLEDMNSIRLNPPAATWLVSLGADGKQILQEKGQAPPPNSRLIYTAVRFRMILRTDSSPLFEQSAIIRARTERLFAELDINTDGSLEAKELMPAKAALLQQQLSLTDRNGDGTLSQPELNAWCDLIDELTRCHLLYTILDHGCGLYEMLDADLDGSLSARELQTAWSRLRAAGCTTDDVLDIDKLPRQLLCTISRGHPASPLGKPVRGGPEWFKGMDRNDDGDLSKTEFAGPANVFGKLDLDQDGLLDAEEAAKASK